MTAAQSTEEEAGRARRRIVALPRSAEAPLAVIVREPEQRAAIEELLGRRRVIVFPSLAHFCSEPAHQVRWAGILVARSCAWDAQLDRYVPYREYIALYGNQDEGHGWPESVKRVAGPEELETWLKELEAPPPRILEKLQSKRRRSKAQSAGRQAEAAATRQRQLELLTEASSAREPAATSNAPSGEPIARVETAAPGALPEGVAANAARIAPAPPVPSRRDRSRAVRTERVVRKPVRKPPASAAAKPREPRRTSPLSKRALVMEVLRAGHRSNDAAKERELMRIAVEIGLHRAWELLDRVRSNAHALIG